MGVVVHYAGLDRHPGKWVAIHRPTDEVVATADSPQELIQLIRDQGLKDIAMMRSPDVDEPIYVGPG